MAFGIGTFCSLLAGGVSLSACASMGSAPRGRQLELIGLSENYRDGVFENSLPTTVMIPGTLWSSLAMWVQGDQVRVPKSPPPIVPLNNKSFDRPPVSGLRLTWLGHNTVLIEMDGVRILTDPVFSDRSSMISWAGPKRFHEAPISIADLPEIDAVIISHDHYDHLDHQSIVELARKTGVFYVPLGVGSHLSAWGVPAEKIRELDWWQEARTPEELRLACTPARHFSGRGMFDRNKTLWATWVIAGPRHRVFFGGDTGQLPAFKDIGDKYGPFDATLMPIGSYGPTWPQIHLTPEQAIQVHQEVRGGLFMPIHWGTFNLAYHGWTEPVERLTAAAPTAGVEVAVPRPGESVIPGSAPDLTRWWPELPWEKGPDLRALK